MFSSSYHCSGLISLNIFFFLSMLNFVFLLKADWDEVFLLVLIVCRENIEKGYYQDALFLVIFVFFFITPPVAEASNLMVSPQFNLS